LVQCYHFGESELSEDELGTTEAITKMNKKTNVTMQKSEALTPETRFYNS